MLWLSLATNYGHLICEPARLTTVGRGPAVSLVVADPRVASVHCVVERRGDELWVREVAGARTFVNGVRVEGEVALADGDRLDVGGSGIQVRGKLSDEEQRRALVLVEAPHVPPPPRPPRAEDQPPQAARRPHLWPPEAERLVLGPSIDNGQLTITRSGAARVQLWNARVAEDGVMVRIPLTAERPPASYLHQYVSKGKIERLVLDPGDEAFEALLGQARRGYETRPPEERIEYLMRVVYEALGGFVPPERKKAIVAFHAAQGSRPVWIGELIEQRAGTCRHRAFLFFHLGRRLGLTVEMCRGVMVDSRHAWNIVREGGRRIFVDCTYGLVLRNARAAEHAQGCAPSRYDVARDGHPPPEGRAVFDGAGEAVEVESFAFQYELRRVPGDEEALLLLYPEEDMPAARYVDVHLHLGEEVAAMLALAPFVFARVWAIVGDEAHHRLDAIDPERMADLRRAFPDPVR